MCVLYSQRTAHLSEQHLLMVELHTGRSLATVVCDRYLRGFVAYLITQYVCRDIHKDSDVRYRQIDTCVLLHLFKLFF